MHLLAQISQTKNRRIIVMKAPEKIYIHPDIGGREFLRPWLHKPANNESVEYTRTDAFIEKVCAFLETYPHMFFGVLRSDVIEDFKKYMEEE